MYETIVTGGFRVDPPLNPAEVAFVQAFACTRRLLRTRGPYAVHDMISGRRQPKTAREREIVADVVDSNVAAEGQPTLYCPWDVSDDGRQLVWNEQGMPAWQLAEWLEYIVGHFLTGGLFNTAAKQLADPDRFEAFTFDHMLFGAAYADGEDEDDRWALVYAGTELEALRGTVTFAPASLPVGSTSTPAPTSGQQSSDPKGLPSSRSAESG